MANATVDLSSVSQTSTPIPFSPSPLNAPPVIVRIPDGRSYSVAINANFDQIAAQAAERVRNRRQWRKISGARQFIFKVSGEYLANFGEDPQKELKRIARAGIVEIQIPVGAGESAQVFPWEFAISEITAPLRDGQPLIVVRHLDLGPTPFVRTPSSLPLIIVQSAPGDLGQQFSFDSEHRLVASSFGQDSPLALNDPTFSELQSFIQNSSPGTIHFAGIDGMQGAELLGVSDQPQVRGYYVADEDGRPFLITPENLATAATAAPNKPWLVGYNFYNSSWPLAPDTVKKGAGAAIAFQDTIDDSIAELFFARLYEAWQRSGCDLLYGYREAWKGLSDYAAKLRGTGIVLWSAASLLPTSQKKTVQPTTTSLSTPEPILSSADPKFWDLSNALQVVVDPCEKLNYSMLHNNRPLFDKFEVKRQTPGRLLNVRVYVGLNTGSADSANYTTSFDLSRTRPVVDVSALARVSLTSDMARSLRESVYTSLSVQVTWEDKIVYQETFRVALLPPDEWRDDDLNRIWLPSFVLPRDPVVAQIVDRAQKYLSTLQDSCGAGFDGYQSVMAIAGPVEERCASVDQQVRALWWSLVQEYSLGYINPPPSFTKMSQRLRTPSDIIEGRRGTCIDLTLLCAALLEYVDIYPVVFLLEGHAFPGYIRSDESYSALRNIFFTPATMVADATASVADTSTQREWILDKRYYPAIVGLVRDGHLVPLESVALTQQTGFWDAVEQGTENLRSKSDFQFLVDIKAAREADVTPIPLWSIPR